MIGRSLSWSPWIRIMLSCDSERSHRKSLATAHCEKTGLDRSSTDLNKFRFSSELIPNIQYINAFAFADGNGKENLYSLNVPAVRKYKGSSLRLATLDIRIVFAGFSISSISLTTTPPKLSPTNANGFVVSI